MNGDETYLLNERLGFGPSCLLNKKSSKWHGPILLEAEICGFVILSLLSLFYVYSQLFSFPSEKIENRRSIHLFYWVMSPDIGQFQKDTGLTSK